MIVSELVKQLQGCPSNAIVKHEVCMSACQMEEFELEEIEGIISFDEMSEAPFVVLGDFSRVPKCPT